MECTDLFNKLKGLGVEGVEILPVFRLKDSLKNTRISIPCVHSLSDHMSSTSDKEREPSQRSKVHTTMVSRVRSQVFAKEISLSLIYEIQNTRSSVLIPIIHARKNVLFLFCVKVVNND